MDDCNRIESNEMVYTFTVPTSVLIAVRATNTFAARAKLKGGEFIEEDTDARDYNSAELIEMTKA